MCHLQKTLMYQAGKIAKGGASSSKTAALSQVIGSTEFVLNNVEVGEMGNTGLVFYRKLDCRISAC